MEEKKKKKRKLNGNIWSWKLTKPRLAFFKLFDRFHSLFLFECKDLSIKILIKLLCEGKTKLKVKLTICVYVCLRLRNNNWDKQNKKKKKIIR